MKKLHIFLTFLCLIILPSFGEVYSQQQLIPAGHWLYDAFEKLSADSGHTTLATDAPASISELKIYLTEIPYDQLSDAGKALYDQVEAYFAEKKFTFGKAPVSVGFNVNLEPYFMAKTNTDLDWTYATDYTGKITSNGYLTTENIAVANRTLYTGTIVKSNSNKFEKYQNASTFLGSEAYNSFISIPFYLVWGDNLMIQTTPMLGKNIWSSSENANFTNIMDSPDDFEFLWPRTAYGSAGKSFDKWGVNFNIGRNGLQVGKTQTGSIILNSTFETDSYAQLNIYSKTLRYALDIMQPQKDKFIYLHKIEIHPFKWIKAGAIEATLLNRPFEVRCLNPFMIMHSFGAWEQYADSDEEIYYGEANVCAYMGLFFDLTPCRYLRIYGLYAQNEIQPITELDSANNRAVPDSLAGQLGFEFSHPDSHNGWWTVALEGVYTTPYMYLKQGADWSLCSYRYDMVSNKSSAICSWIGSPFGPDAIGAQGKVAYSKPQKWSCELQYLYVAHGTNSFGLFNNTVMIDGKEYYAYYPSVLRRMHFLSDEESEDIARSYALKGVVQFTNQITAKASYKINPKFDLNGRITYTFVFNNGNVEGETAHGFEFCFGGKYSLF